MYIPPMINWSGMFNINNPSLYPNFPLIWMGFLGWPPYIYTFSIKAWTIEKNDCNLYIFWCGPALHTYSFNARKILQIQKTICNYCKRYLVSWKKFFVVFFNVKKFFLIGKGLIWIGTQRIKNWFLLWEWQCTISAKVVYAKYLRGFLFQRPFYAFAIHLERKLE